MQRDTVTSRVVRAFYLLGLLLAISAFIVPRATCVAQNLRSGDTALVRGAILRDGMESKYPATNAKVMLTSSETGKVLLCWTDTQGMYYFRVKAGKYVLAVFGAKNKVLKKYTLTVSRKFTDVNRIIL